MNRAYPTEESFMSDFDESLGEDVRNARIAWGYRMGHIKSKPITVEDKIGRNDPCPCNSGKKYKKCCGR